MGLQYRILGPLEVVRDGEPVVVSAPKERALLVLLLLRANELVSVERLGEALWPERQPRSAVKLLQLYVSNLRKVLGVEAVLTSPGAYRIDVRTVELDSLQLPGHARRRARRACPRPRPRRLRRLRSGLVLWRGSEVAGGTEGVEAAHLEELRLQCLEERLTLLVELGAHDEALPGLKAMCAEQPLRERPRAQLMLALYRAGRQADALAVFRERGAALDDELGLEPGEELRTLERAILRHDPALASPAAPERGFRLPAAPTQLIGRDHERAELRALVQREEVRLVSLVGAGGSGKTRLALAWPPTRATSSRRRGARRAGSRRATRRL